MRKLRIGIIGLMTALAVVACSDNNYPPAAAPAYNGQPTQATAAQSASGLDTSHLVAAGVGAMAGHALANRNSHGNQYRDDYDRRPVVHKTVIVNKVVKVYNKPKRTSYSKRSYSSSRSYSTSRSYGRR